MTDYKRIPRILKWKGTPVCLGVRKLPHSTSALGEEAALLTGLEDWQIKL